MWIADLVDEKYTTVDRVRADPRCGDFCDLCGDCLRCYGNDPCYYDRGIGEHQWVVYADQREQWRADHPTAVPLEEQ